MDTKASDITLDYDKKLTFLAEISQKLSLVISAEDLFGVHTQRIHFVGMQWH